MQIIIKIFVSKNIFVLVAVDWYKTEQLCPDLQEAVIGKDIDTANYPYKSVFRFMDQPMNDIDLPCILETNGPKRLLTTALIDAIHVDSRPWNFSGAQTCGEHIKLRLPEPTFLKRSSVPKIICRIRKSRSEFKEATGSLYHPYVWQFQKGKLGLSFSSFNLTQIPKPTAAVKNANSTETFRANHSQHHDERNFWLEPDTAGHQFVQIVFTTRFERTCNLRVQQYLVNSERTLCDGVQQRSPFRLCGLYDCSEKEQILRTLGFWTHRKEHEKLDFLLQSVEAPRWRQDPTYLEILVSSLRALLMPVMFISVFYVTRRLRLKLASRRSLNSSRSGGLDRLRQRQCYLRSLMRDGGGNSNHSSSSDSAEMLRPSLILNHVVYDVPVSTGEYPAYEDLPPPYESIVEPPSYLDATSTVKSSSPRVDSPPLPPHSFSISPDRSPPPPPSLSAGDRSGSTSDHRPVPVSNSHHQHASRSSIIDEEVVQLISPPILPPSSASSALLQHSSLVSTTTSHPHLSA